MPFTNFAKDTFLAPGMSEFTELSAPDLGAERSPSIPQVAMVRILRVGRNGTQHALELNLVRRGIGAASEYRTACNVAREYLRDRSRWERYYAALGHFEVCLSQVAQANELAIRMLPKNKRKRIIDESPPEYKSLRELYNASKHAVADDNAGKKPLAVWLTNERLEGFGKHREVSLTYVDLASLVNELGRIASTFCNR